MARSSQLPSRTAAVALLVLIAALGLCSRTAEAVNVNGGYGCRVRLACQSW
jgi:hypothetical protein